MTLRLEAWKKNNLGDIAVHRNFIHQTADGK